MKGLETAAVGAPYVLTDKLEKPKPGKGEILCRSVAVGVNPVDTYQSGWGILVAGFPIVLGCDASAEVVELGEGVTKFKVGDYVYGCTQLGVPGHSTYQEYFIMDEPLAFKKPDNVTVEQAATLGVGTLTACLGLIRGLNITFPKDGDAGTDEWVVIFGGAGSVGQYAIQIAKICGYKVLTTCSPKSEPVVKAIGASATVNYRDSEEDQMAQIKSITGGNFCRIMDASAKGHLFAFKVLTTISNMKVQHFSTVDDWTPKEPPASVQHYEIQLGPIGQADGDKPHHGHALNSDIPIFIEHVTKYLVSGQLKPNDYEIVGDDWADVAKATDLVNKGAGGGKKYIVMLGKK